MLKELLARYPNDQKKSALIPLLHHAQKENGGWLSVEKMDEVARQLDLEPIEVYEVATFYSMYHLKPTGKYVLDVCHTGPCALMGSERCLDHLKKKNLDPSRFTVRGVECLAACDKGPVMQVGDELYENLDEEKIDQCLEKLS